MASTNVTAAAAAPVNPYTGRPFSAHHAKVQREVAAYPVARRTEHLRRQLEVARDGLIVIAPTGSGKSTKAVLDILHGDPEVMRNGGPKIMLTQPRQLAARKVAERLCEMEDVAISNAVGLIMRGVNQTQAGTTRVEVVTDGIALAMLRSDDARTSSLQDYKYIFVDEVHERSVNIDLMLVGLKAVLEKRASSGAPLKVIFMSATMDPLPLQKFLPGAIVERVDGRTHPVRISYLKEPATDEIAVATAKTVLEIHKHGQLGDILVFASGEREIRAVISTLEGYREGLGEDIGPLACFPLHAQLPAKAQELAVTSHAPLAICADRVGRKVIVATNYAETSVTIPGIVFVVDSLTVKSDISNPRDETSTIYSMAISKAQADQRAGRAGRNRPGFVYRLCTEVGFAALKQFNTPEILLCDLLGPVFSLIAMGHNPFYMEFPTAPASESVLRAVDSLVWMDLVNLQLKLTPLGKIVVKLDFAPDTAVILLKSSDHGCSFEILSIVCLMEALEFNMAALWMPDGPREVFKQDREDTLKMVTSRLGDHFTLLNLWTMWQQAEFSKVDLAEFCERKRLHIRVFRRADELFNRAVDILVRDSNWRLQAAGVNSSHVLMRKITRSLCYGLFLKVARMQRPPPPGPKRKNKPKAKLVTLRDGKRATLYGGSPLERLQDRADPVTVVYQRARVTKDGQVKLGIVTAIDPALLIQERTAYFDMLRFKGSWAKEGIISKIAQITGWSETKVRQESTKPALSTPVS